MIAAKLTVGVGTTFQRDGEILEIVEIVPIARRPEVLAKELRTNTVRRLALAEVMSSDRCRILTADFDLLVDENVGEPPSVRWAAVAETARREARARAAHVREVLTGYQSGSVATALPHEPRSCYRSTEGKTARVAAKAREIGVGVRTVQRWVSNYQTDGEIGLLSEVALRKAFASKRFSVFERTASEVMHEYTESSTPTKDLVIAHTKARLNAAYGAGAVPWPSQATAYRILAKLEREQPLFSKSTKRVRDIAARPARSYGALLPSRPGEYLLMDTTPLDVYAMDPNTLQWVGLQLTVAMDWYSRCILGLALTPTTKSIDVAQVLYQCFQPAPAGPDWPAEAVWPPHGVPRSVLVEKFELSADSVFAATPAIVPDTLVIDHGSIYVSEQTTSTCRRLGVSIQPARLRTGSDKGPVERFFRTVRQGILQELPGYKGPDVYSRGSSPENEAFFFVDELDALLREWIAAVYHLRPHDGVGEVGLWKLRMSPSQMFEHGLARAGYIEAPRDPAFAYNFLKVEWRTIQHYGFEIDGRYYRGPGLTGYSPGEKSSFGEHKGRWPVHVDPNDIRFVYFFDHKRTRTWHALTWKLAPLCNGPMNEDGLRFARELAKTQHRYFDDKLAMSNFLKRRNLDQARSVTERNAALRLSRQQSHLTHDLQRAVRMSEPSTSREMWGATTCTDDTGDAEQSDFTDDLDDDTSIDGGHFYDDVLEDL